MFWGRVGSLKYADFFTELHNISLRGLNYANSNPQNNGEYALLERLKEDLVSRELIFFDVGANIGDYVKYAASILPGAHFYCFEPSKDTFSELVKQTQGISNIICENIGIGDTTNEVMLYKNSDINSLSSIHNRDLSFINVEYDQKEMIRLNTIDNYCSEKGINNVDFLKLDIEGNEFNAFKGAARMLNEMRIKYIQFEIGGCNIDSKVFWKDIYRSLSKNYRVFRILKDGIYEFNDYREIDEIFIYSNLFASVK
jgi:FkbM family methyltransferase